MELVGSNMSLCYKIKTFPKHGGNWKLMVYQGMVLNGYIQ